MTVVAGLIHDGKVYVGADSLGVSLDGSCCIDPVPKVFRVGDFLFGCSGYPRMKQLLRYVYAPQAEFHGEDREAQTRYLVCNFIQELQSLFALHNFADEFKEESNSFLVGFQGRLFCIYSDYNLEECKHPYNAIGCASDIALGSLHTTARMGIDPVERLRLALDASEHLNAHVQRPFIYEEM